MRHNILIKAKLAEAFSSVLPVTIIMLLLMFTITPMDNDIFVAFLIGVVLLIIGMGLFTLGAENSMSNIGERVGADIVRSRKMSLIIFVAFVMGFVITISEPDLTVLATQIPAIPNVVLIYSIGIGVGIFLAFSLVRIIFHINLKWVLIGCYVIVFVLAAFVPKDFLAIAFDSGGVTTGPMTVPFILALGYGVSSIRSDESGSDSFGLVALSSVGPILTVMILGLVYPVDAAAGGDSSFLTSPDTVGAMRIFLHNIPEYMLEVGKALLPIVVLFFLFQILRFKMNRRNLIKIIVGLVFTYIGLVFFLTGVNVGFMPAGRYLGTTLGGMGELAGGFSLKWISIPVAMVIGYYIVKAEPAVHVMTKQVNEVTAGAISDKMLLKSLSIGMAVSLGLAMIRALTGLPILYFLVPGYLIAIVLSFVVPDIFTAIAFDSGGVASGPMTATFLLPFAMGICEAVGGNAITDAFGVVAMVAMTPLITIQITGLVYSYKKKSKARVAIYHDLQAIDAEEIVVLM